jgi:hypothetical protein
MMQFRSASDFDRRAQTLGVQLVSGSDSISNNAVPNVCFSVENSPYAAIALARRLVSWLGDFGESEFWISEFGIWPSREDWNLYERFRAACHNEQQLFDAPSHLLGSNERADLETLLGIAIAFGWGGHIIPDPPLAYIYLSHDGWVFVASMVGAPRIKSDLDELEIEYQEGAGQRLP